MSKQSLLFALALAFVGALLASASIEGGVLDASWTAAATTSNDGSALASVALYRLYYGDYTSDSPCPDCTFVEVASPTSAMQPNDTVSFQLTGLTALGQVPRGWRRRSLAVGGVGY